MSSSVVAVGGSGLERIELEFENVDLGLALGGLVDVGDVGAVVFVVVDFHGGCINIRLERFEGIKEVGDGIGVGGGWDGDGGGEGGSLLEDLSAGVGSGFCGWLSEWMRRANDTNDV